MPDIEQRLRDDRVRTLEQIAMLSDQVSAIIVASADVATDDEHDPEGQTIAFERAQAASLLDRSRERLADIDAALARLSEGAYETCELCGRPIGAERLNARPAARTCIACALHAR